MLEGIWYGTAAALVFFGLVCAAYIITAELFRTGSCGRLVLVLSPEDNSCDIGSQIYSAHMRLSLLGGNCREILIVDNGLNENQLDLCERIMNECGGMRLCSASELADVIAGKEK